MRVFFSVIAAKSRTYVILLSFMVIFTCPALGFELFGIHLWGEKEEEPVNQIRNPIKYETTFTFRDGKDYIEDDLRDSSLLIQQQDIFPSGVAGLVARAQIDQKRLIAALYRLGTVWWTC